MIPQSVFNKEWKGIYFVSRNILSVIKTTIVHRYIFLQSSIKIMKWPFLRLSYSTAHCSAANCNMTLDTWFYTEISFMLYWQLSIYLYKRVKTLLVIYVLSRWLITCFKLPCSISLHRICELQSIQKLGSFFKSQIKCNKKCIEDYKISFKFSIYSIICNWYNF